ncbi:MAG: hypothetical protein QE274_06715 [Verrucomicrobiaceae bacterium]|nr:hypothetical protein [Verrucomicrobiaceae bacterium]
MLPSLLVGWDPESTSLASSITGIAKQTGSLEAGKKADVMLLSRKLEVRRVFIVGIEMPL